MTEVIIYRNPMEAAIWQSLMSGGWVIFVVVVAAALAGVAVYNWLESWWKRQCRSTRYGSNRGLPRWKYFVGRHMGKMSIAVSLTILLVAHLVYMS